MTAAAPSLAGRRIGITAERRSTEQADLFTKRGATVVHGPVLHTVDLADDRVLKEATESFVQRPPEWFLATTGYGVRLWLEAADGWGLRDDVLAALARVDHVLARGAKSRSALTQAGVPPEWTAPGESMPEVVDHAARHGLAGASVAVQLFDPDEHPTTVRLRDLVGDGGSVVELPVYRWELPADLEPAQRLLDAILAGELDAVTFTSQPAVRFLFQIARSRTGDAEAQLRHRLNTTVLPVCIGPVCAEAGVDCGVEPERLVYPEPYRLVPMVKLVEEHLGRVA